MTTLRRKRDAIENFIAAYEAKVATASRDLAHVNATLVLFKQHIAPEEFRPHMSLTRLFKIVVRSRGMDDTDAVLRQAMAFNVVSTLAMRYKRGLIGDAGKRKSVRVWNITVKGNFRSD